MRSLDLPATPGRQDFAFAALGVLICAVVGGVIVDRNPATVIFLIAMGSLYLVTMGLVTIRPGHGLVVYMLLLPLWEWARLNLVYRDILSYGWATLGTRWEELFFVLLLLSPRRTGWREALTSTPVLDFFLIAYFVLQVSYFAAAGFAPQALWGVKVDYAYFVPLLLLRFAHLERADLQRIFLVAVGAAAAVALFGIYQVHYLVEADLTGMGFGRQSPFGSYIPWNFRRDSIGYFRAISVIGDPLSLSTYLLVVFLWCLPVAVYLRDRRITIPLRIALAILAAGLYFTFTRSSWIGAAAGVAFVIVVMARRRETIPFALVGIVGVVTILYVTGGFEFIKVTFNFAEPSSRNHFRELFDGFAYMLQHPFGIGIGKVGRAFLRFLNFGSGFGVESWWLQIGIELGIFGLFLYLALSLEAVRLGWRAFREAQDPFLELFALGAVAAFGGLTVYGITLPAWGYVAGPYLATLVIGLAIFHVRRADRLLRS